MFLIVIIYIKIITIGIRLGIFYEGKIGGEIRLILP